MRPRTVAVVPLLAALLAAAPAAAQDPAPAPAPPPVTTPPPPPPPPAPAAGKLSIALERVGGKAAGVLAGDRFRVRGSVTPYVAGQQVVVRLYRRGRKIASRRVAVKPVAGGARGTFVLGLSTSRPGRLVVRASHRATPQQVTMVARGRGLTVLALRAAPGAKGPAVRVLQRKLRALGYVVGAPGVMDGRTARAVLAFRKVAGMARTMLASKDVFRRLARGGGRFKVRYPNHGKHVEADLSRQVLALVHGRKVQRIYPISSGSPATPTVLGSYRVYRKDPGTNAKGMVFSSYFIRGYAIHGYVSVPPFAASHGCLRVPVPDAVPIFNWVSHGDYVDVYS